MLEGANLKKEKKEISK